MGLMDDPEFVELATSPENMLLVDEFTSLAFVGTQMGTDLQEPMVLMTFEGKLNNSEERATYTVALAPADVNRVIIPRLNQRVSQLLRWIQRNKR